MSNFNHYDFRIKMVTDKINEEIAFYDNCDYHNILFIRNYLTYLKNRIGTNKMETTTMTHYDNFGNKKEIKKMNFDEYSKDIDSLMFNKPWTKLREFHKIMKIKEYINNLEYGKKPKEKDIIQNKKYLIEEICSGIKNKKFGKNKSEVIYDQENMTILSISSVDFNKKTGLYEVDWDA
jgi:hypothetical protein